jgi:dihydrolipoamide dehydrogenase
MAETRDFDVIVLGGGPGGYVAAIRAGQLGMKTAVVEKERVGGVCLNWGCIPSKALLKNSELYRSMKDAERWGIKVDGLSFDFAKVIDRSRTTSDSIVKGVEFLLKKNKVETIPGTGTVTSPNELAVETADGKKLAVRCKHLIIATGGRPRPLPFAPFDGKAIMSSRDALDRRDFPKEILIIGAGAIGSEFASFYNAFGSQVTLIEALPAVVPLEDAEVSAVLKKSFERRGMTVLVGAKVASLKADKAGVTAELEINGKKETFKAATSLVAIGVMPNTENLGLEKIGVTLEKGFIKVDDAMRTNVPGVYAIGDVNGPPLLAHVASAEGIVCVERIAGHKDSRVDYGNFPSCTYCQPQIGSTGVTEEQAKAQGLDYKVGKFPFTALGKAKAVGETEGFVKLILGKKYGEILGAHIVGADAAEQIAEICVARAAEATGTELHRTIHAHPTFSEAVMEAAAAADGEAIHF